jgi:hypothetical protein
MGLLSLQNHSKNRLSFWRGIISVFEISSLPEDINADCQSLVLSLTPGCQYTEVQFNAPSLREGGTCSVYRHWQLLRLYGVGGRWKKYVYWALVEWYRHERTEVPSGEVGGGVVPSASISTARDKSFPRVLLLSPAIIIPPVLHTHISFLYHRRYIILAFDSVLK